MATKIKSPIKTMANVLFLMAIAPSRPIRAKQPTSNIFSATMLPNTMLFELLLLTKATLKKSPVLEGKNILSGHAPMIKIKQFKIGIL